MHIIGLIATLGPALVLAGTGLWAFWRRSPVAPKTFLSEAVLILGNAVFFNLAYPWYKLGYYARSTTVVLLAIASLTRVLAAVRRSSGIKDLLSFTTFEWVKTVSGVVMAVVIPATAINVPAHQAVALGSPFSDGIWYVAQGGGSILVNHHYSVIEQRYGLDFVRLNSGGRSCSGPGYHLESYGAWGSTVVSPTQGVVISAVDGLPDMDIGRSDRDNPAGNHVILETVDGIRLLLAHLRQGSIVVHEGQRVDAGQVLAQVGNSGNSSEPHLHIQAMMRTENGTWIGIPLKIQGRILHRGQLLRSNQ